MRMNKRLRDIKIKSIFCSVLHQHKICNPNISKELLEALQKEFSIEKLDFSLEDITPYLNMAVAEPKSDKR